MTLRGHVSCDLQAEYVMVFPATSTTSGVLYSQTVKMYFQKDLLGLYQSIFRIIWNLLCVTAV